MELPKEEIILYHCFDCGRTEQHNFSQGKYHYWRNKQCYEKAIRIFYVLRDKIELSKQ